VQGSIFVGLSGRKNEDYDREWWGRAGAWLLFFAAAVGLLSFIAVFGPVALYNAPVILGSIGGGAGIAAALLGFSDKTSATQKKKEEGGKTAAAGNLASALIVPLFVVFLLAAISLGSTWIIQQFREDLKVDSEDVRYALPAALQAEFTAAPKIVETGGVVFEQKNKLGASPLLSLAALRSSRHLEVIQTTTPMELLVFLALGLLAWMLSYRIGVNRFSMAALYRNRLIRAYLGASRDCRQPNPFTGSTQTTISRCGSSGRKCFRRRTSRTPWHSSPRFLLDPRPIASKQSKRTPMRLRPTWPTISIRR
jgi:hypothetical protein